jgi:hypothetical protein
MSYARADDELPPNRRPSAKGFVTSLLGQLEYEFLDLGAAHLLEVWRDIRKIDQGDQFDPKIEDAIRASDLFLAVLSPNWMASEYCREELESFLQHWQHEGELRVKQRIIVACKKFVDRNKRPSLLQGQQGFDFFTFERPKETGAEIPYFVRGEIRDDRYEAVVRQLAEVLNRRGQHVTRPSATPATRTGATDAVVGPPPPRTPSAPQPGARKIYLAKPASDMRAAYSRLVEELTHSGYAVVPDPGTEFPQSARAETYIDTALNSAELSIHLLGRSGGFTPEQEASDKPLPIVQLQLARAAARLEDASAQGAGPASSFRRIIWAPELLEEGADQSAGNGNADVHGTQQPPAATERRPDQVLRLFGDFEPTDKVVGGNISKFVDFLINHLRQSVPRVDGATETITGDDWVYVYHAAEDTDYACNLMEAFNRRGVSGVLPALEGDPSEVINVHKKRLSECAAIVLCWANATEAWAHARADELKNWEGLGRQRKFKYRGLLAGPPPGVRKTVFVKFPPANEIDVVVNQNDDTRPLAEIIDKFVNPAPPQHAP